MMMYCMVYIEPLEISILYGISGLPLSLGSRCIHADIIDGYYIICHLSHPTPTK